MRTPLKRFLPFCLGCRRDYANFSSFIGQALEARAPDELAVFEPFELTRRGANSHDGRAYFACC